MAPTISELNRVIERIKAVQKRFGNADMQKGNLDTSFEGRSERCKNLLRASDEVSCYKGLPCAARQYQPSSILIVLENIVCFIIQTASLTIH